MLSDSTAQNISGFSSKTGELILFPVMSLDLACSLNLGIPQKFSQTFLSFPYGFSTLAPSHITQTPIIPSRGTTSESAFPAQAPCIHDKVCAGLRSWSKEHG